VITNILPSINYIVAGDQNRIARGMISPEPDQVSVEALEIKPSNLYNLLMGVC